MATSHQPVASSKELRKKGLLIAFEGIDGSGKSTQLALLKEYLEEKGYSVVATKEPTDGPWGRQIKELPFIGQAEVKRHPPGKELELFTQDRGDHVERVIGPALKEGKIVLTDRYYFSTMAYQGALGIDPNEIEEMNEAFAPRPDLVLLLVCPPKVALARIRKNRKKGLDPFERERYLERVQEIYQRLDRPFIAKIETNLPEAQVARNIQAQVEKFLRGTGNRVN